VNRGGYIVRIDNSQFSHIDLDQQSASGNQDVKQEQRIWRMRLDVIIPTYNRCRLLERTFESLLNASAPSGLDVKITVVDNNSTDLTRTVVEKWAQEFNGRLGDLVGMIDDDEEIDRGWYARIQSAFSHSDVDFIGGPYVPRWGASPPAWLPINYVGVIGWIDGGNQVTPYDKNYPGILMGGNAIIARAMLQRVGLYKTSLSRTGKRLLAGEDEDMYQRLLAAGARGLYLPDLIIHHYVPPERLTKRYFRQWCFWRGVSRGTLGKEKQSPEAHLAGVPRWLYGEAARGALRMASRTIKRQIEPDRHFSDELAVWDLAGFFYGRHFYKAARSPYQNDEPVRQSEAQSGDIIQMKN
jgi:cellulose synthase/poly-beta-1,6-N-acetylglucosamine synthase-like glycosyltransferase